MVEGFRQWAVAVCAAAVLCTLLRRLFPDTRLGQQGRLLLIALFLLVLLAPLLGSEFNVKLSDFTQNNLVDSAALEAAVKRQVSRQMNEMLLQMVNQSLGSYGWEAKKVEASMDIEADGSISMGQIVVYVDEDTARRATAVGQIVEKRLGTAVQVAVWEEQR